ncbi:hypothetical protein [Pseudovibrio sp. WM33]|uniref:hypothetical protein n=1 Tax=Pseudovibrio sp. WM33 TaxID=1735585 RepID=UPI0007AEA27A|nr:hypothetical protein [Pseudovibrio sp. WM33]KZL20353.1 hypothetical protein PsWM33_04435 [Pseudovibrio sp. WM33]
MIEFRITDFDCLSVDQSGERRFVVFTERPIELGRCCFFDAHVVLSETKVSYPCVVYTPRPNGKFDPPHFHMRAKKSFCLDELMNVGDLLRVESEQRP